MKNYFIKNALISTIRLTVALSFIFFSSNANSNSADQDSGHEWSLSNGTSVSSDVSVCIYRDEKTANLFAAGEWTSRIGPGLETCSERVRANLNLRLLYLDFDPSSGDYLRYEHGSGHYAVRCNGRPSSGNYSPCRSSFLTFASPQALDHKVFDSRSFINILRKAKVVNALEQEREKVLAQERHDQYVKDFELVATLEGIESFENKYTGNDPDGFIQKLHNLKTELEAGLLKVYRDKFFAAKSSSDIQAFIDEYKNNDPDGVLRMAYLRLVEVKKIEALARYRNNYEGATTSSEFQSFITDYENNDPDNLVPIARKKLGAALKAEKELQLRKDHEEFAERQRKELDDLAFKIIRCNREIEHAQKAIEREREIVNISGYENKIVLRQAGEMIVYCRESVARDYKAYRKKGGTKMIYELK